MVEKRLKRTLALNKQRWSPPGHILKSLASKLKSLALGLQASSSRKLPCPRLEDSTIFWTVEILLENAKNLAENLQRPFVFSSIGDRLKKKF